MDLRDLLPLLRGLEVNRLASNDPGNHPTSRENRDPAARDQTAIVTAESIEIEIAVPVNVPDDQPEFIHVGADHYPRASRSDCGKGITQRVGAPTPTHACEVTADHISRLSLRSGRRTAGQEICKKRGELGGFSHSREE